MGFTWTLSIYPISKVHGMYYHPTSKRWVWVANTIFNTVALAFVIYAVFFEINVVIENGIDADMETATILCGIMWITQSIISMLFCIRWQVKGDLWNYLENVVAYQKGASIAKGMKILKSSIMWSRIFMVMIIVIVVSNFYGPEILRKAVSKSKYEYFNPFTKPLHVLATIHILACWNMAIFLFKLLTNAGYLEMKHFNDQLVKISLKEESELKMELVQLIVKHSKIATNVRRLDNLLRVYAFTMLATMIPSTLLTLIMLAHRVNGYVDVLILGLPSLCITMYGFLGMTLAPARLYEEMCRSKNCLCENPIFWTPYRPEIYQLSMALSSHMEQPNMGLTIWGFAILSKPLILATLSGMIMVLSLILEIVPTIEQIVEEAEMFHNKSI